jgi:hypothetical protein
MSAYTNRGASAKRPSRAETCCVLSESGRKKIVALLEDSDIHRLFNMACNRMIKYRIVIFEQ